MKTYAVGDKVIYQKEKVSSHPGFNARDIHPARNGDNYFYRVDKCWLVSGVRDDGSLEVITRTGKRHHLMADDPRLHKATLFERVVYRSRFPKPHDTGSSDHPTPVASA